MQKKRSIKIIAVVMILVLICLLITYSKNDSKVVLATTKEFNTENLQDNEHMHVEVDNDGDKVPVPNGYVGSKATGENEIDTGYVIYEGTEEVNDDNVEEAQKTRNQYVWIPVPDASTMYGTDANGKKWGKLYDFTTETGEGIDPVTGAKPLNWSESDEVMKIVTKSFNREPDVAINYDADSKLNLNMERESLHTFLIMLEQEFNSMIESVDRYGGFYIGRYETGNLSKEKFVIKKGNIDLDYQTWYTMYKKCKNIGKENTNAETGMIWGSQWDRTLTWLVESKNKTKYQLINSTNWGNYKDSTFEFFDENGNKKIKDKGKTTKIPTGNSEYTKSNNIYDLAGNARDWTMECYYDLGRYSRSYSWGYNCSSGASYRYGDNTSSASGTSGLGCRAMLYIK